MLEGMAKDRRGFVQRHQPPKHTSNIVSDLDSASHYLILLNRFDYLQIHPGAVRQVVEEVSQGFDIFLLAFIKQAPLSSGRHYGPAKGALLLHVVKREIMLGYDFVKPRVVLGISQPSNEGIPVIFGVLFLVGPLDIKAKIEILFIKSGKKLCLELEVIVTPVINIGPVNRREPAPWPRCNVKFV